MNTRVHGYMNKNNKYLQLRDIGAYKLSFVLSNFVWDLIVRWNFFERKTIGSQFTRSIDSISANVAKGFGRRTKKDKIKFYYYAYASIYESLDWNEKSLKRGLISHEDHKRIYESLENSKREINFLIRFTRDRIKI